MKNIRVFLSENFQFLEVKFSIYLNRHVFVMNIFKLKEGRPQARNSGMKVLWDNITSPFLRIVTSSNGYI